MIYYVTLIHHPKLDFLFVGKFHLLSKKKKKKMFKQLVSVLLGFHHHNVGILSGTEPN